MTTQKVHKLLGFLILAMLVGPIAAIVIWTDDKA